MQQEGKPYIQVVKLNKKKQQLFWCHLIFLNFEKPSFSAILTGVTFCVLESLRSALAKLQVLQEEVFQSRGMILVGKKWWFYPLNIQKTMENHNFQWVNPTKMDDLWDNDGTIMG